MKTDEKTNQIISTKGSNLVLTSTYPIQSFVRKSAWPNIADQKVASFSDYSLRFKDYNISFKEPRAIWKHNDNDLINVDMVLCAMLATRTPDAVYWLGNSTFTLGLFEDLERPRLRCGIKLKNDSTAHESEIEFDSGELNRPDALNPSISFAEQFKDAQKKHNLPSEVIEKISDELRSQFIPKLLDWADTRSKISLAGKFDLFPDLPSEVAIELLPKINSSSNERNLTRLSLLDISYTSNPLEFRAIPAISCYGPIPRRRFLGIRRTKNSYAHLCTNPIIFQEQGDVEKISSMTLEKLPYERTNPDLEQIFEEYKQNDLVKKVLANLVSWTRLNAQQNERYLTGKAFDREELLEKQDSYRNSNDRDSLYKHLRKIKGID